MKYFQTINILKITNILLNKREKVKQKAFHGLHQVCQAKCRRRVGKYASDPVLYEIFMYSCNASSRCFWFIAITTTSNGPWLTRWKISSFIMLCTRDNAVVSSYRKHLDIFSVEDVLISYNVMCKKSQQKIPINYYNCIFFMVQSIKWK